MPTRGVMERAIGWRSPWIRRDTAGLPAGTAVMEREDICGRSVAPRLAEWGTRPPARWRVATSVVADAHADGEPHAAAAGLS